MARIVAPAALVLALIVGTLVRGDGALQVADPASNAADRFAEVLEGLPDGATVLVGFDPDIGTYAEIRPTVRTVLAELAAREARIAFVSLTPEGRALALAELSRLARLATGARPPLDLGFVPGAEAALVVVARAIAGDRPLGASDDSVDLTELDLIIAIGGNDLGPRSWVEQVAPRVGLIPIAAVSPAVLLPEVQPYLESGQLTALISTPREGADYRASAELGGFSVLGERDGPAPLAILLGLLAAIAYLGAGIGGRVLPRPRPRGERT